MGAYAYKNIECNNESIFIFINTHTYITGAIQVIRHKIIPQRKKKNGRN